MRERRDSAGQALECGWLATDQGLMCFWFVRRKLAGAAERGPGAAQPESGKAA